MNLSRLRRALCVWRCAQCRKRAAGDFTTYDFAWPDPSGGAE